MVSLVGSGLLAWFLLVPRSPIEQIGIFVSQKETQVVQVHCEQAKVVPNWSSALAEPFGGTGGTDEREAGDEMMRLRPGALGQMILWVLEMLESVLDGFLTRVTSHVLLKRCAEGPNASCGESSQSLPHVSY